MGAQRKKQGRGVSSKQGSRKEEPQTKVQTSRKPSAEINDAQEKDPGHLHPAAGSQGNGSGSGESSPSKVKSTEVAEDPPAQLQEEHDSVAPSHASNSVAIKEEDTETEDDCVFRLVISGEDTRDFIEVPRRQDTSFQVLREEINEMIDLPFMTPFQFTVQAGGLKINRKAEANWNKRSIWNPRYDLTKQGDGSHSHPYRVFIEEAV
jgi:hypothetical protein